MNFVNLAKQIIERLSEEVSFEPEYITHYDMPSIWGVGGIDYPAEETIHKVTPKKIIEDENDELEIYSREEFHANIHKNGIETIAFYAPIHFYGPQKWGIYINYPAFKRYSDELCIKVNDFSRKNRLRSLESVLDHEYFHFEVELFCLIVEGITASGIYKKYKNYPKNLLEEALANSQSYRKRNPEIFKKALADLYKKCPRGYSDFETYIGKKHFDEGIEDLKNEISKHRFSSKPPAAFFSNEELLRRFLKQVPLYRYSPRRFKSNVLLFSFLANIKPKKFIHFLEREYNAVFSEGSRHSKVVFPGGRTVMIPRHRQLKDYLIKQIALALNVSKIEIIEAYQKS